MSSTILDVKELIDKTMLAESSETQLVMGCRGLSEAERIRDLVDAATFAIPQKLIVVLLRRASASCEPEPLQAIYASASSYRIQRYCECGLPSVAHLCRHCILCCCRLVCWLTSLLAGLEVGWFVNRLAMVRLLLPLGLLTWLFGWLAG
jgi:hypothetical protein